MTEFNAETGTRVAASDAEAIHRMKLALASGKHWYLALLEAIGSWGSVLETRNGHTNHYLIDGEAFDWLLLAERICDELDELLPTDEKNDLVLYGRAPLALSADEVRLLVGNSKYRQYLNYFYGVTVEEALVQTVREEVHKERYLLANDDDALATEEAHRRVYGGDRDSLLRQFRKEKRYSQRMVMNLTEIKEFTYWLFKYRLEQMEKARVASDTRKALAYLKQHWQKTGSPGLLFNVYLGEE